MQVSRKAFGLAFACFIGLGLMIGGYYSLPGYAQDSSAAAKAPKSGASTSAPGDENEPTEPGTFTLDTRPVDDKNYAGVVFNAETPLAEGVKRFNERVATLAANEGQPPLTDDEVVAAIRGWIPEQHPVRPEVLKIFQEIAATRKLPAGSSITYTRGWTGYNGFSFDVWWVDIEVRLIDRTEKAPGSGHGYTYRIRDQKIRSRPMTQLEKQQEESGRIEIQRRKEAKARVEDVTVRGTVLSPDGKPVAGATVRATTPPWAFSEGIADGAKPLLAEAKTDAKGQFTIAFARQPFGDLSRLDPRWRELWKAIRIIASAPGYGAAWAAYDAIERDSPIALRLVPDVPIRGRVVDPDGRPVAALTIEVRRLCAEESEDLMPWLNAIKIGDRGTAVRLTPKSVAPASAGLPSEVTTDSQGRFEIRGAGRERYLDLTFHSEKVAFCGIGVATRSMEPITSNGASDFSLRRKLEIFGAEFTVTAEPSRPIVGTVSDAQTGQPLKGVSVECAAVADFHLVRRLLKTTTDEQGRFRLVGLPKGNGNALLAVPNDDQPYFMRWVWRLPDPAGLDPLTIDIQLHGGLWITGRATDKATGEPVVGARMHYLPFRSNQFFGAIPESREGSMDQMRYRTGSDGSYRLVGLPGRAIVGAESVLQKFRRGLGADVIEGLRPGGHFDTFANPITPGRTWPSAMKEIDPPAGAESVTVNFELDPGQSVRIAMLNPDGQPVSGVMVDGVTSGVGKQMIDNSTFEAMNFAPDETRTILFQHEGLKLGLVARISAGQSDVSPVAVKLLPMAKVKGRLVGPDGAPLPRGRIVVLVNPSEDFRTHLPSVTADAEGRFECELLPGASYTLAARGSSDAYGIYVNKDVSVESGQTKDLGDVPVDLKGAKQRIAM